jgi:hypothetical protein
VPLYCCEDCGWAFTGLRVDAVHAHRDECPVCAGVLRLAFEPAGRNGEVHGAAVSEAQQVRPPNV